MIGILQSACRNKSNNTRDRFIIGTWGKGGEKVAIWNIFSLCVFISENV